MATPHQQQLTTVNAHLWQLMQDFNNECIMQMWYQLRALNAKHSRAISPQQFGWLKHPRAISPQQVNDKAFQGNKPPTVNDKHSRAISPQQMQMSMKWLYGVYQHTTQHLNGAYQHATNNINNLGYPPQLDKTTQHQQGNSINQVPLFAHQQT